MQNNSTETRGGSSLQPDCSTAGKGFARSPDIIKAADGPQMEDYPDWDSWYFARKKWVFERMSAEGKP